jgi:dihydropteroate synthase
MLFINIQNAYLVNFAHYTILKLKSMSGSLNCGGKILSLASPLVMGIINVNHDSFYTQSRITELNAILKKVSQMIIDGASIIDIGAMSSKPGALISNPNEEISIITPIVRAMVAEYPNLIISIDTIHSQVANAAVDAGATMINDISAGDFDEKMIPMVAALKVPYIMMHKKGMPEDMQISPQYDDVVMEIITYFVNKIKLAREAGILDLIIDPGFGFGKTIDHNYEILKALEVFQIFDVPILAGISRKSMIYKYLESNADEALNGTTALNMFALLKGAKILRVHDVKEASECIKLYDKLKE